ncbi:DUF3267 domain-containing protein [Herbivorax sp. ANBcel31]|uniref:DUF3267 domain-containing protein n=1 Tax=Herbivorax sp. ANBcel31 TaxID=3069754 RepID=UPI0027B602F4|nr:DUF3267 domain-containing protein [Herbivorax sp. ANBcel31]MDQ2085486.1 DUF3267 domain-containing protein [Herbivorax sp. ANBcel31]
MTKIGEFKLNKLNSFVINSISLLVFVVAIAMFFKIYHLNLYDVYLKYFSNIGSISLMFFFLVIIIALHELIHGIGYKIFGARLKFGFKHLNIYTMDISGNSYRVIEMFVIMLLPLLSLTIFLSVLSYIFKDYYFYFILGTIFNISSSVGDIILFSYMLIKGSECKIKDTSYGFLMYKKL